MAVTALRTRAAAAFAPKRRHHRPYAQEAEGAVQISGKCESCAILAPVPTRWSPLRPTFRTDCKLYCSARTQAQSHT
jgi:hypothetical protein